MEKQRKVKLGIIVALIVAVIGVGIGFASTSLSQLDISTTASVNPQWNVEFITDNTNNLVYHGATIISKPTLTTTAIKDLNVEFDANGGAVAYFFKVKNKGSINAKVGEIITSDPVCSGGNNEEGNTAVCNGFTMSLEHTDYFSGDVGSTSGESEDPVFTVNSSKVVKAGDTLDAGSTDYMKLIIKLNNVNPYSKTYISNLNTSVIYTAAE